MIRDNLKYVQEQTKIHGAVANRAINDIKLIAVSKTKPISMLQEVYHLGVRDFGENKVQELSEKHPQLPQDINWHLIGHLQTNKVKQVIDKATLIHSVDSVRLAEEIGRQSVIKGLTTDILLEVNVSGEESKYGMTLDFVDEMIDSCTRIKGINVKGLMTMAPLGAEESEIRRIFSSLYKKYVDISTKKYDNISMEYLSMGMSGDFHIAIEEGANIVRVGRGLFQ